jgi:sugar fermentation stimulation protein A
MATCTFAFVIAMPGVSKVLPNVKTHPEFGIALEAAMKAGVKVLNLPCNVMPDELSIAEFVLNTI